MNRAKILRILAVVGGAALVFAVTFNPINSRLTRIGLILALMALFVAAFWVLRKTRWRFASPALAFLVIVPFLLPGRPIDQARLRADYVASLRGLDGTLYVWGAESSAAIDCSGLPRTALRSALWKQGILGLNGAAVRAAISHWWFDASALALGQGYRGYTVSLKTTGKISEMSYDKLLPGDLAVTNSGGHILAYMGDGKWIQADPGIGHVAILDGRKNENSWFTNVVTTHRWALLAGP